MKNPHYLGLQGTLALLNDVKQSGEQFSARCPAHDDTHSSLTVAMGRGRVLLRCHAGEGCGYKAICKALRIDPAQLFEEGKASKYYKSTVEVGVNGNGKHGRPAVVATYDYTDAEGKLLYQAIRLDPKGFYQRQPNGEGGYINNLDGVSPVPYRLPHVLQAIAERELVFVVEGERDVHTLETLGFVATCNAGGAGKWRPEFSEMLAGADIVSMPDNDDPGKQHVFGVPGRIVGVAPDCHRAGCKVRVLNLPGLGPKEDVSDWVEKHGGTREQLMELIANAPDWQEVAPSEEQTRHWSSAVLTRLADVQPQRTTWIWPGRIPRGKLTVLDGDPGLGKSLMTMDLAARVTRGDVMPDKQPNDLDGPAGVVVLNAEDGLADTVRPRLEAHGAVLERVVALTGVRRLPEDPNDLTPIEDAPHLKDIKELEEAIASTGAALAIIDPLMAFLPDDVNAHRDQQIRRVLAPIAALAERTNAAILVVRHLNKGSASNPLYRGGGSIGIVGAARSGLLVARDPDDETGARRVLAVQKCNLAAPVPALTYTIEVQDDQPVIKWGEESTHTAGSLLAEPERGDEKSAVADARAFLRELLEPAPMAVKDIKKQATAAGIFWRTVERAKGVEGVRSSRAGFTAEAGWLWTWPDKKRDAKTDETKTANTANEPDAAEDDIEDFTP
jgi:RecA-family ATPase